MRVWVGWANEQACTVVAQEKSMAEALGCVQLLDDKIKAHEAAAADRHDSLEAKAGCLLRELAETRTELAAERNQAAATAHMLEALEDAERDLHRERDRGRKGVVLEAHAKVPRWHQCHEHRTGQARRLVVLLKRTAPAASQPPPPPAHLQRAVSWRPAPAPWWSHRGQHGGARSWVSFFFFLSFLVPYYFLVYKFILNQRRQVGCGSAG